MDPPPLRPTANRAGCSLASASYSSSSSSPLDASASKSKSASSSSSQPNSSSSTTGTLVPSPDCLRRPRSTSNISKIVPWRSLEPAAQLQRVPEGDVITTSNTASFALLQVGPAAYTPIVTFNSPGLRLSTNTLATPAAAPPTSPLAATPSSSPIAATLITAAPPPSLESVQKAPTCSSPWLPSKGMRRK